jgi:LmbE family N-acetylglucosaminyl deacetylase
VAGLDEGDLLHLDLLPPLRQRNPTKLRRAAPALRAIIDEFKPTVVVMPMFEGGHIHHDMVAAIVGAIATPQDRFKIYEAPEYGPYFSLNNTPHRVIAFCARWLLGVVSYYGPPDGVDSRPIVKFQLDEVDHESKRRMLAAFASQNAPSLVGTRSYSDRLVLWQAGSQRRQPFDFAHSYLRFVMAARRLLPPAIVDRLLPVQLGTIGREGALTDWWQEWSPTTKTGEESGGPP